MSLFDREWKKEKKEFSPIGLKSQRRNLRKLPQKGTSDYERDVVRKALLSGKRISKSGDTYWETRKNRSDALHSKI